MEMRFTLGTYNLRMEHLDSGHDNCWAVRKPRLLASLRSAGFDVAGLQEVNSRMQRDLTEELGNEYSFWFFSPYSQNGEGDKAHGIMFKKSLFDMLERSFSGSPTLRMSVRWRMWDRTETIAVEGAALC